jgi:predicted transcriptional regulator
MSRDDHLREIGAKLRGKRAYRGLSQKGVEDETGIDTSELSRIETGRKAPRFDERRRHRRQGASGSAVAVTMTSAAVRGRSMFWTR